MFEITGDDIASLSDEDLRALVGRLCEAELWRLTLSPAAVTWGGNQTAKDGGLDVRVALPAGTPIDGFIPRSDTGFQVKKPDMPRGEIIDEMKPKGMVRQVIVDLAAVGGAYVIVSANGSTADSALKSRRDAMAEAVKDIPDAAKLKLDFYDRGRLATWLRHHAGLIPWVRSRIGKSVPGWRSFGSWSHVPTGADPSYLLDEAVRIKTGDRNEGEGLKAVDGIDKIRDALRAPGSVVRLVGLSGVGKTRLVEALFDATIGTNSLDPSLAIYTNVAEGPDPQPPGLAADMVAARTRAILIIDNCPPETHRQLSDIVRTANTTVSLITVEYDIREDQPEGTDVFVLDTSSLELIQKLIERRFPALSQIDRRTIAESSGGNARVALALAATVGKNETVAGLNDAELFKRLFHQRHDPDASLLAIAEVCSLVYSFDGETIDGEGSELAVLGGLIGKTAAEVFAGVAELKRRDLLQERGPWRAVLPHAIANRMAALALANIPRANLLTAFVENAPARLLQSFSRRLGYLDSIKEAQVIVQAWLAPGGLLADVVNLNEIGKAMFTNIAPVMPDAVLSALENVIAPADEATLKKSRQFLRPLRSLAFDPKHFARAVALLARIASLPVEDRADEEATNLLQSLFYIVLSGTHAPLETRLGVTGGLLRSANEAERVLGAKALEAMLKTSHFSSTYGFDFGVRSRDYGYYPPTGQAVRNWFAAALQLAESFALSDGPAAGLARKAIAREFRGLWTNASQADALERIGQALAAKGFWREGWISARRTRIFDGAGLAPDVLARLKALEELLRPKDLVDKVRGVVLGSGSGSLDLDEVDEVENDGKRDYAAAATREAKTVEALGRDVAADEKAFETLLPVLTAGSGKVGGFGRGLGAAADNPAVTWREIVAAYGATEKAGLGLLCGFLEGVQTRDAALADTLLDTALEDPSLAPSFPVLQACGVIDEKALARLHLALERGTAPINTFYHLAHRCDGVSAAEFSRLALAIAAKPDGMSVALEMLSMRLHSDHNSKRPTAPETIELGRALLMAYQFQRQDGRADREDYELGTIAKICLAGAEGKPVVRRLCRDLLVATESYEVYAHNQDDLMAGLFRVHPTDVLDELVAGDKKAQTHSAGVMNDLMHFGRNPMGGISDETIIGWCDADPSLRYPFAAAIAPLFNHNNDETPLAWKDLARKLLLKAPDKEAVFKEIAHRLYPTGGVGPFSTQYDIRLKLLNALDTSDLPMLAGPVEKARAGLKRAGDAERLRETAEDRQHSGRFE